jgi:methylated-DNA-protein-cysteine methyltransferase-like protein
MVGRALRLAPAGLELPWHRVVTASGRLAFAAGSGAYEEQCRRLGAERVGLSAGRVCMREHRWRPDLDELLWRPNGHWDRQP